MWPPDKKQWTEAPALTFTHGGDAVPVYPYVVTVLLEANTHSGGLNTTHTLYYTHCAPTLSMFAWLCWGHAPYAVRCRFTFTLVTHAERWT